MVYSMVRKLAKKMYEIYKIDPDTFQIHSHYAQDRSMEGSQLAILTYAAFSLGFDPDELQAALLNMIETGTDSAHFGVNRTFLYCFNRSERKVS